MHDRRLAWLQPAPQRRDSGRGGIAIAQTLVTHAGKLREDVGWGWDQADERPVIAHDEIISHDVCPSRAHYPIEWRRLKKRDTCPAPACQDQTAWCLELLEDALTRGSPGAFTVDSYCTSAQGLHPLQRKQAASVGALQLTRKGV